jgi:putative glycosyltransferase
MKLSIVTTLYLSEPHLEEFYRRMTVSAQSVTQDYEIIMVHDGSPDQSLAVAKALVDKDSHGVVIDLSRNFGHHKAIMAGLSFAQGDFVFLIDCDLEEDPENLKPFYEKLTATVDCDVVYGVQPKRKSGFFHNLCAKILYHLLNTSGGATFDENMVFSRVMTRRYVQSLLKFGENELFIVGLWSITGYTQLGMPIPTRHRGKSSYSFSKKVMMALDAITSFSNKPLHMIFYAGFAVEAVAFIYSLYVIGLKVFYNQVLSGWSSVIISVWMLGGAIILCLGVIGQYLSRAFIEVKHRPYVIIKEEYRHRP